VHTRLIVAFALAPAILPAPARAQSESQPAWRATAGSQTFAFRDIARSKPPVDASPVEWEGSGPIVTVDYDRARPLRLHRFEVTASTSGSFFYQTGIGTTPASSDDHASFFEGQYDYRRYLARELGVAGLHAGVGVRGGGERRRLEHHYSGGVTVNETTVNGSIAIVAALRYRPHDRFSAEAEWGNAAALAHGRQDHVADVSVDRTRWGGGWITDLAARGEIRVAPHLAAVIFYLRRGEGLLSDHRAYTSERHRVMAGMTYAR
jgi:hypothetical protein